MKHSLGEWNEEEQEALIEYNNSKNMIWPRLKSMKCPQCNAALIAGAEFINCSSCSFKIRKEKLDSLVADMYKPKNFRIEGDNAYELNNLDLSKHEEK